MDFRPYHPKHYEAVLSFLVALNENDASHINWNWARFEWMIGHPYTDIGHLDSMGLWFADGKVAGAVLYDMYVGEAFCAALPEYQSLYPEILDYAFANLKDENGLGIAIGEDNQAEIEVAVAKGFSPVEQTETVMAVALDRDFPVALSQDVEISDIDPSQNERDLAWMFWQGFDHGDDYEQFLKEETKPARPRPHFNPYLNVVAVANAGEKIGYACLWYDKRTDYAYVEPLCVIPSYRGKGIAKALLHELFNRAKIMGAKKAYVISDSPFYAKLGFRLEKRFSFYWKKP